MKILVTGAAGFLGTKVMNILKDDFELIGTEREKRKGSIKMDITDRKEVFSVLERIKPDIVLHIAAMADVDACEIKKDLAWSVNVEGTKNIIEGCKRIGAKMIHISTDVVFDGKKSPYKEDDKPNPLSYYAKTKFEGEKAVRESGIKKLVLRVEVLYGYNGDGSERSFTIWAYENLKKGKEIRVVNDQFNTPTLIDDIANAIKLLIKKNKEGLYHVAGSQSLSRYEMAVKIAEIFGFDKSLIKPITSEELKQIAPRPKDTSLDIGKLIKEGITMHTFEEGIKIVKKQMGC